MPKASKSPAFQFYASDWLTSTAVEMMPPEVEGTYVRLLCRQWLAVTLPADPAVLRSLTKLSPAQWKKAWPVLAPHFPLVDGGAGRQNPQLQGVRADREQYLQQSAEAGKKGAKKRWGEDRVPYSHPIATPMGSPSEPQWGQDDSGSGSGSGVTTSLIPEDGVIPSPTPDAVKAWVAPHGHAALDALFAVVSEPAVWVGSFRSWASGMGLNHNRPASPARLAAAVQEFVAMGKHRESGGPSLRYLRGFVENAKDTPAATPARQSDAEHKAEQLRDLRDANDRRQRLGYEPKPLPPWAEQIDAMFPDGRTYPVGVAA